MPNLDALLQGHRDAINVKRVYGDPIERDGVTIVPAAAVMGGTGGGGNDAGNGGGGLGLIARPVGVWEIRDGSVTWRPAASVNWIAFLAALVALALLRRR
jgi:uncharacterized spore protein YtfJ